MNTRSNAIPTPFFVATQPKPGLAANGNDQSNASELFEELYRAFWGSFYSYLQARGYAHHDAEDLIQGMFAHLIQNRVFDGSGCADAKCSVCRHHRCYAYLLSCLKNHLSNEWDYLHSTRRGGEYTFVPWMDNATPDPAANGAPCSRTPVDHLEARAVSDAVSRSVGRLRTQTAETMVPGFFDSLEGLLLGDAPRGNYADVAAQWGLSETALRMSVSRLRQKLRQLLTEELEQDSRSKG